MTAARRACVVAALGAAAYLVLDPATADHAAQEYRAGLGSGLWDNGWFAGHHTPAYSVLSPALGALLGVQVLGALCAVAAAGVFGAIAERRWGARAGTLAAAWFSVGAVATLVSGRVTFLLGVAVGLGAVLALQRGRPAAACALAALTSLASPVAALFLAVAALAAAVAAPTRRTERGARDGSTAGEACAGSMRRRGLAVAICALAPAATLAVLFPEGGTEPFVASAFWPALAAIALVAVALPARERALRAGAVLYALLCVAAFAIPTPLGGNATRLGALVAGPVLAGALLASRERRALLAALAVPLAYWQLYPAVRDVVRASGDPATAAAWYAPLIHYLDARAGSGRVEVPLTENHWEAAHLAPHVALARGWERQLDRRYGALFYDGTLSPARYRAWLDEHAVAYVALPRARLDYAARDEARLVAGGLAYLRPVWRHAHWHVFAVDRPAPLVAGAARTIELAPTGFTISASRRGDAQVRVRHSRWFAVASGRACVRRGPGGMTTVQVMRPGRVRVEARLTGSACRR